jgi:hypothetical protein
LVGAPWEGAREERREEMKPPGFSQLGDEGRGGELNLGACGQRKYQRESGGRMRLGRYFFAFCFLHNNPYISVLSYLNLAPGYK